MSAGLTPPRRIIAHGFWLMGGAKMSKSLGNVARYQDYTQVFGLDGLRYFVDARDAARSGRELLGRGDPDAVQRGPRQRSRQPRQPRDTMVHRYRDGRVPASPADGREALDRDLLAAIGGDDRCGQGGLCEIQVSLALQDTWDARPARQQVHRRARAVEAGEGPANDATLESDALSRRGRASRHCGARRSGDAGRGGSHSRNARHRQRRVVDDAPGGNACGRCATATGRAAVPADRKDRRGTSQA